MIFLTSYGKEITVKKASKYLSDWDSESKSLIQKSVKDFIYDRWFADRVFEEFPVAGSRLSFDFYNATKKMAIEVDGSQHYQYNKFFHSNSRQKFLDQLKRDQKKDEFCEINNIKLFRILEDEIREKIFPSKEFIKWLS